MGRGLELTNTKKQLNVNSHRTCEHSNCEWERNSVNERMFPHLSSNNGPFLANTLRCGLLKLSSTKIFGNLDSF